jgi:Domain of unknown function (DUF4395)
MKNEIMKLDKSAIKFNQGSIVIFTALAFLLNIPLIIVFTSLVMSIGTIFPKASLFKLIYKHIAKPAGLIKPNLVEEDNSPHQFAQGLGGVFLVVSFIALTAKMFVLGWTLALIVLVLAFINLTVNFCAGCFIYFQLYKLGILKSKNEIRNEHA